LKATYNEGQGTYVIEAEKILGDIKISHDPVSETKIPNKCETDEGLIIWDCPGFEDTNGIVQEIANSFYIQRLFEISENIK